MKCPKCESERCWKRGFFVRLCDGKKVQTYSCRDCGRSFSDQTGALDHGMRRFSEAFSVFERICSGVSQRRLSRSTGISRDTVARIVDRLGAHCQRQLALTRATMTQTDDVTFDEMESFEHTKLKPLTIPLAVDTGAAGI